MGTIQKLIPTLFSIMVLHFNLSSQVYCIECFNQKTVLNPTSTNMLLNGSFETTNCSPNPGNSFCPASLSFNCSINNWTCTGGGSSTYAHVSDNTFSIVPDGNLAVYFGNLYADACGSGTLPGDTTCLTFTGCVVPTVPAGYPNNDSSYGGTNGVSLSQMMTGLTVGASYTMEFWAGGEWDGIFPGSGLFAVDVGYGNIFIQNEYTDVAPTTRLGKRVMISFNATSISQNLKFTNWGHICNTCTELILDDVHLYPTAQATTVPVVCADTSSHSTTIPCIVNFTPNPTNVFSPNNDTKNDLFYPLSEQNTKGADYFKEYDLKVYDRWGITVFATADWSLGWNGKMKNGMYASEGVYFWILNSKNNCYNSDVNYKGNVQLLR